MTLAELIKEYEHREQNARDNAAAENAVSDHFMPEYTRNLFAKDRTEAQYARAMQIYDFAIRSQQNARRWAADAIVFRETLEQLYRLADLEK